MPHDLAVVRRFTPRIQKLRLELAGTPGSGAVSRVPARLAAVAFLLVMASCGTCGSQPAAAEPIEGYWSWEGDGVQQIKSQSSGNFEGTMVKLASIGSCAAPVGHVVLKLHGSAKHYTGQDEWYRTTDCARKFSTNAVLDLTSGNKSAHLCSTGPFTDVAPVSNCVDLLRIAGYKPA